MRSRNGQSTRGKPVSDTSASKAAGATGYQEAAEHSVSSGYAHPEEEEVANLKIPAVSQHDSCCNVRPSSEDDPHD